MTRMMTIVLAGVLSVGCTAELDDGAGVSEGELKALRLQTGEFWCDATGCGFTPFDVHVGMEFHVSGCGFTRNSAYGDGGESIFSATGDWTYGYDLEPGTGCISQGGSSTYTAPATAGDYTIRFYTWDYRPPYAERNQGVFTLKVLP